MATETKVGFTPGPWSVELVQKWPFGVRVTAGDMEILSQAAYCSSTKQRTRQDCELGVGFGGADPTTCAQAQAHIATQDANARLIAQAPAMYDCLKTLVEYYGLHTEEYDHARAILRAVEGTC